MNETETIEALPSDAELERRFEALERSAQDSLERSRSRRQETSRLRALWPKLRRR
jgi:hypothetical protein